MRRAGSVRSCPFAIAQPVNGENCRKGVPSSRQGKTSKAPAILAGIATSEEPERRPEARWDQTRARG
jgi:hypothetical protein